jgi:hypothetical protein
LAGDLQQQGGVVSTEADAKLTEEPMKSLSELAGIFDEWAKSNETTAEEILACLDSFVDEVQEQQRRRAGQLVAEAAALKTRAAELRKLEGGMMVEEGHGVCRTAEDRDRGRDRPRTIWRYNRFR